MSRSDVTPQRRLLIAAGLLCAIAALGLGVMASMDICLTGFPDSHVTEYDKAADAPKRVVVGVEWALVLLFLALPFVPVGTGARAIGLLVALVTLVLVATVQWIGIPWYFMTHLGLDNGVGG
jgi:hypothetical protein